MKSIDFDQNSQKTSINRRKTNGNESKSAKNRKKRDTLTPGRGW